MPGIREALRSVIEVCQGVLAELESLESIEDRSTAAGEPPAAAEIGVGPPERGPGGSELSGADARAERGPERLPQPASSDQIGTRVAFDRSNRIESVGRSIESRERPLKGLSLDDRTIDSIGAVDENEVRSEPVRFLAERIARALRPKVGRRWRDDRRLIATAAVVAIRLDAISGDSQMGQRWVQAGLDAVAQFEPKNVFGYFTRCLQNGLREIDPAIRDQVTAAMIWVRLTRRIPIPESWLAEPERKAKPEKQAAEIDAQIFRELPWAKPPDLRRAE